MNKYEQVTQRLYNFYEYDIDILDAVATAAASQDDKDFTDITHELNVQDGPYRVLPKGSKYPLEILQFTPTSDYDETEMRVYHLPIGNPVSPSMVMRGARQFAADPTVPLMLVGNPSSPGMGGGRLTTRQSHEVMRTKSLRPTIEPLLVYLRQRHVKKVTHMGYSYGFDKAITAAEFSGLYGQISNQVVGGESAALVKRSPLALGQAFMSTAARLDEMVRLSDSNPYNQSRQGKHSLLSGALYAGSLVLRPSSLSMTVALAGIYMPGRVTRAVDNNPDLNLAIAHGTESELDPNDEAEVAITDLERTTMSPSGKQRVFGMAIKMPHAGADEINNGAAMMLQGMKLTARR